jgi:hypothetical protein
MPASTGLQSLCVSQGKGLFDDCSLQMLRSKSTLIPNEGTAAISLGISIVGRIGADVSFESNAGPTILVAVLSSA